jgi:hypothetical protein
VAISVEIYQRVPPNAPALCSIASRDLSRCEQALLLTRDTAIREVEGRRDSNDAGAYEHDEQASARFHGKCTKDCKRSDRGRYTTGSKIRSPTVTTISKVSHDIEDQTKCHECDGDAKHILAK